MPNPFSDFRMRNIFNRQSAASTQTPSFRFQMPQAMAPQQFGGAMDWNSLVDYPATPALEAYKSHIETMPQRENPSAWNRIAAAMGGFSEGWQRGPAAGIKTATETLEYPYKQKYIDWT